MSGHEKIQDLTRNLTESQAESVARMIELYLHELDSIADEAFCEGLYQDYLNDPNKGDTLSFTEALKELGLSESDLQD